MKKHKRSLSVVLLLACLVFVLLQCMKPAKVFSDPRGKMYAGSSACRQCHEGVYDSFQNTAHNLATSAALHHNFLADFKIKNVFAYDSLTRIVMEKRDDGYYQVLYVDGKQSAAYKIDIIFGSRNAQTFVYWNRDETYELPVSWYAFPASWGTSPGFPNNIPRFDRLVNTDCYDCHSSSFKNKINTSINESLKMDSTSLVYGIDCERCHGPGANHVNYHTVYPEERVAKYMSKYASFTREQKIDACAVCHSGNDKIKIQSRFDFTMGDTLDHFFMKNTGKKNDFDVHGNQYGLLSSSACFISSAKLDCGTCHDPHKDATGDLAFYSQKCMSCHNEQLNQKHCPKLLTIGASIKENCIDCHMPKRPSDAIGFQLSGASNAMSSYLLRTHKIGVWEANKK